MSYVYDVMQRVFEQHFNKGDRVSMEFSMLIQEMHSANHRLNDAINKDSGVCRQARDLEAAVASGQHLPPLTEEG